MYKYRGVVFILSGIFLAISSVYGQVANSPFTSSGLGDINPTGLSNQLGMAGAGMALGDIRYINNQNPALLIKNGVYSFSAGMIGESRTLTDDSESDSGTGANLAYLVTTFPISKGKWTSGVGLMPYTVVNYNFSSEERLPEDNAIIRKSEEGSGGINQLYWMNGIRINDIFSVGFKTTYLFSSITSNYIEDLIGTGISSVVYSPLVSQRDAYSGFMLSGSVALNKEVFNGIVFGMGFNYDMQTDVGVKRLETIEQTIASGATITKDTIENEQRSTIFIPSAYSFGVSLTKPLKWALALDVRLQNWSDFENFDDRTGVLADQTRVSFGGEFTPDAYSVDSYLSRVTYRLGVAYEQTPYIEGDNQVNDFGINFGMSLPVGSISSLDLALQYGQRGDVGNNTISEEYFRMILGITFNDRFWFRKRKFD